MLLRPFGAEMQGDRMVADGDVLGISGVAGVEGEGLELVSRETFWGLGVRAG